MLERGRRRSRKNTVAARTTCNDSTFNRSVLGTSATVHQGLAVTVVGKFYMPVRLEIP